jgi:hypothetical protein
MGDPSPMPGLRQAEPRATLIVFCLSPAHLEPLRADILAARVSLDGLSRAAAEAVSDAPVYTLEALRIDVTRHGRELEEQLVAALAQVEVLAAKIREGGRHVA